MLNPRHSPECSRLLDLQPEVRTVLYHIWSRYAGQSFDDDKLRTLHVQRMCGMEVQLAFASLLQQGWVQAVKQGWGEKLYYIPFHKLQVLQENYWHPQALYVSEADVKLLQEGGSGITVDIFNVIVFIAKNRMVMTSKGVLHKKLIQKLGEVLGLTVSDVDELGLHYHDANAYPPHVAVILDLLFALDLVVSEQAVLKLNMHALRDWLMLSREGMDRIILRCLMERYVPCSAGYQHFTWRICHFSITGGRWYTVDHIMAKGKDSRADRGLDEWEEPTIDVTPWLRLLTGCGYTDLGIDNSGNLLFRWRRDPGSLISDDSWVDSGSGKFFIQADYEILIPPDVPNMDKFTVARFTERVSDDQMTVYRLTRESVAQAAETGLGLNGIVTFLTEHAATGIPENVRTALSQWGKEIERAQIVGSIKRTFGTLEEETEILWTDDHQSNRYAMRCQGFSRTCGLIRTARSELSLEAEECLPHQTSVVPTLNHIPVMWTREWRTYHSSTAKQMMEQALELSAKLELAVGDGRKVFIPLQLERQPWKIFGTLYDPKSEEADTTVTLSEGEWKEMRLMIPS